jgi:hypothetical protein
MWEVPKGCIFWLLTLISDENDRVPWCIRYLAVAFNTTLHCVSQVPLNLLDARPRGSEPYGKLRRDRQRLEKLDFAKRRSDCNVGSSAFTASDMARSFKQRQLIAASYQYDDMVVCSVKWGGHRCAMVVRRTHLLQVQARSCVASNRNRENLPVCC